MFLLDLIFLAIGVYGLLTSKLPDWIIGKNYALEHAAIRKISYVLITAFAISFISEIVLGYKGFENSNISRQAEIAFIIKLSIYMIVIFINTIVIMENKKLIPRKNKTDKQDQE